MNPEVVAIGVSLICGLLYFERRMTKVETKVDMIYNHVTNNTCPVIVKGESL